MRGVLIGLLAALLVGCGQGDSPARSVEFAVQGAYAAAISPAADYGIIGSIQHGSSLWDLRRHERLYNWNHKQGSYTNLVAAAFSPDGEYAVTADQQTLVLWEVASGQPDWFWTAPAAVLDLALATSGDFALLGLVDHTAVYFDIKNGGVKQTLYHDGRVRSVSISNDGSLALTGSDDNVARLWNLRDGKLLQSVQHGNGVNTVALSPNGRFAFSAGQLDKAVVWDTQSGRILQTLTTDDRFFPQRISYTAAVFSSNGNQLLTGTSSGLIQLWDTRQGQEIKRWEAHKRDPFRPTSATIYGLGFGNGLYYALASNGFLNELK